MFKKVLIANRGEIALRVISACQEMGIKTVAVYSEPDAHSLHVRFADEEVCIGPAKSADSYLNIPAILSAAEITGADALHPGYGFLAESSHFAEVSEACRVRFIGPSPRAIRLMGDKALARATMKKAKVPVLPGSEGALADVERAEAVAKTIGFPVMLKAAAGGGGKGMRIVVKEADVGKAFLAAQKESMAAFGSDAIYIEKYLSNPRHIEIQLMADRRGTTVHLGERDCSIQRRHQKLLEEAPSPIVSEKLREKMGRVAVQAAQAVRYEGAGTVEFLLDEDGRFYFMEMNTRIQVEHPVTEMVTGMDLVKDQIRVAAGEPLGYRQKDIVVRGASIECRINAEDPVTFAPSPGTIHAFHIPGGPGVRVDTAAHSECVVTPYYDSLIAKLVVHGRDRQEAIARMRRCLNLTVIEGVKTTVPLHLRILDDPDFRAGRYSTRFLERMV
jgi:acetyl-CoA carboxylase biotin carboxylase subunit